MKQLCKWAIKKQRTLKHSNSAKADMHFAPQPPMEKCVKRLWDAFKTSDFPEQRRCESIIMYKMLQITYPVSAVIFKGW